MIASFIIEPDDSGRFIKQLSKRRSTMKKPMILTAAAAFGLLSVMISVTVSKAQVQSTKDFVPPIVF